MTQRRVLGLVAGLLLLTTVLSGCGSAPVAQNWPGLTIAGDTIYVISGQPQKVYILDAESGAQKQTFVPDGESGGVVYWSPVAQGEDMAFVGFADSQSGDAGLYAFDPVTGKELWNVAGENLILPAPTYADGVVYFGDSDGKVYAVDVETQSIKPGWPFQAGEAIWAPVLVAGGRVYVAAMDHYVYCLDAESGQEIWQTEVGGALAAEPALDPETGVLYVGAFDGRLYALDVDSGEEVEGFDFQAENWIWSEVLVDGDRLYVTSLDGRLYALDPSSGEVIAPYPYDSGELSEGQDVLRAAPVDAGEYIVVASEGGRVIAVNNGQRQWSWPTGIPEAAIYTTPVVFDGTIYVVLMNGQVQALDAETGNPAWAFSPPEEG